MPINRLLVIDDDEDFADGLAEILELDGSEVDICSTGEGGVAAAKGGGYAAILIDIGLPDTNGVQVMLRIKADWPETPCLLLTGYSADHLAQQGISQGAAALLTKPVSLETLQECLEGIIGPPG